MVYAAKTDVPVERSRAAVEKELSRYGASSFAYFTESGRAIIVFEAHNRRIRFDLPLPSGDSTKEDQQRRSRWRALLLCVKAKLESVESKIETFEEAFLAHVVMPDGISLGTHAKTAIENAYKENKMVALMPPSKKG